MNHLEVWELENFVSKEELDYNKWLYYLAKEANIYEDDLDRDGSKGGYSLDDAYDKFKEGISVSDYAQYIIKYNKENNIFTFPFSMSNIKKILLHDVYIAKCIDEDSLSRLLYDEFDNKSIVEVFKNPSDLNKIKKYFNDRFLFSLNNIRENIEYSIIDNNITLYRDLHLETPLNEGSIVDIGKHFSYSNSELIKDFYNEENNSFRVKVEAKLSDIDWFETIANNTDYLCGDDEQEITLNPNSFVKVLEIEEKIKLKREP